MPNFKEHAVTDAALFTNPDECGTVVEFAGQAGIAAVLEDVEYDLAKHGHDGLNLERKQMFVPVASLEVLPVPGQQETLNGAYWAVASVLVADGMAEILLERGTS